MSWIFYVLSPVLVHLVIAEGTAIIAGNSLDSAALTALSAFLALPAALWMYRQDEALHEANPGFGDSPVHESEKHPRVSIFHRKAALRIPWLLISFLVGGLLNILYSSLLNALRITSYFSNQTQEALLTSSFAEQLLGPGLLVPIAEELIFRGLVYTRMKMRLSVRNAIIFSSLLFALYHGNPIQMIYAFPMALLLALLYERGDSILYPILFHMGANLAAILSAI